MVLRIEHFHRLVVRVESDDPSLVAQPVVPDELARALDLLPPVAHRRESTAGPRPLPLGGHLPLEAFVVDGEPALARHVGHEVFRKPERVVEAEHDLARNDGSPEPGQLFLEHAHPLVEGRREPDLLLEEDPLDHRPLLGELGIRLTHLRLEVRGEAMKERLAHAQPVPVPDGAPDDAAEHVSAPLVRGEHPVHDEKGARADVVRDDPERLVAPVLGSGQLRGAADEIPEQIDLVVPVHTLQHRGGAFEPHAGIHRRLGKPAHVAVRVPVELHEDEVPDLDESVPVLVGGPGRPARDLRAVVVEHLGARAARPDVPHRPEVVLLPAAHDARRLDADVPAPDVRRLVVVLEDGDPHPVPGEAHLTGEELPREDDRLALEVVAEAEVPEHLEEGVMAGGIPDVLEIVVLAPGPDAALGGDRAGVRTRVRSEKHVLELDHARIGEEQRRIVSRHERAARNHLVPAFPEVVEKGLAKFVARVHSRPISSIARRTCRRVNPRPRRKRACRAASLLSAGSAAPKRFSRAPRARASHSSSSGSRSPSTTERSTPRASRSRRIRSGPPPRSTRERMNASAKRESLTRPRFPRSSTARSASVRPCPDRTSLASSSARECSRRESRPSARRSTRSGAASRRGGRSITAARRRAAPRGMRRRGGMRDRRP